MMNYKKEGFINARSFALLSDICRFTARDEFLGGDFSSYVEEVSGERKRRRISDC